MVAFAIDWRGGLDILVNNAGVAIARSVLEATPDEWQAQLDVNLRAPFFALQAAARHMVERGSGKIVNTVSTSGFASSSTPEPIYDLTKGGLRQLTISAAVELAPLGVNVNGVAPGTIGTDLTNAVLDTPEKLARATARIPAARSVARPTSPRRWPTWRPTTPTTCTATCSSSTAAGWRSSYRARSVRCARVGSIWSPTFSISRIWVTRSPFETQSDQMVAVAAGPVATGRSPTTSGQTTVTSPRQDLSFDPRIGHKPRCRGPRCVTGTRLVRRRARGRRRRWWARRADAASSRRTAPTAGASSGPRP